jgi:TetR/AcrR family transcriptional regulator
MVALKTFLNLSEERQEQILLVCLEEFACKDYESASLSDIIKKLGLAKGSFYRYFESKRSLYLYLLEVALRARLEHDKGLIREDPEDFFESYGKHFEARLKFEARYPFHSAFLNNLLRQKSVPELSDIQTIARKRIVELLQPKLLEDIRKKKIRKDKDPELLAFLMGQTQMLITDYINYKYGRNIPEDMFNKKTKPVPEKEMIRIGKEIIELLKTGYHTR